MSAILSYYNFFSSETGVIIEPPLPDFGPNGYPNPRQGVDPNTVNSPVTIGQTLIYQDWENNNLGKDDVDTPNFVASFLSNDFDEDPPVKKGTVVDSSDPIVLDSNNFKALKAYTEFPSQASLNAYNDGSQSGKRKLEKLHTRYEIVYGDGPSPYWTNGGQGFDRFFTRLGQEFIINQRIAIGPNWEIADNKNNSGEDAYTSIFEMKQDGHTPYRNRDATYKVRVQGTDFNVIVQGATTANQDTGDPNDYKRITRVKPPLSFFNGKFHLLTHHLLLYPDSRGFIKTYLDGQLIYSETGPNSFWDTTDGSNDISKIDTNKGPYIKSGIYNPFWRNGVSTPGSTYEEIYMDFLTVGIP